MRIVGIACVAGLFLGGCAVLSSESAFDLDAAGQAPSGVTYYLPKGLVELSLAVTPNTGAFVFSVGEPTFVPDPAQQYFMRYRALPNFEDEVTVTMNEAGKPYFKTIKVTTTDKTKEVLVNLTKSIVATVGYEASGDDALILAKHIVDPADEIGTRGAIGEFDAAARRFINRYNADCLAKTRAAGCKAYAQHHREIARKGYFVSMSVSWQESAPYATPADCAVGICYRPKEPLVLSYSVGNATDTKLLRLPNRASLVAVDLKRAILVSKVQTLEFDDDGFLKSIEIDKPSEALALAQLPLQLASAVSEALQLRIDYTQRKISNAEKEGELIDKKTELRDALQNYEASQARAKAAMEGARTITLGDFSQTATQDNAGDQSSQQQGDDDSGAGEDDLCAINPLAPECAQ